MLEKAHIAAVVRELKKLGSLHSQSMTFGSLSMNGTPDRYFDGARRDLWIEFKRLTAVPRNGVVIGDYSPLQLDWMQRRWRAINGCNAWGVVGLPDKRVVVQTIPDEWVSGTVVAQAVSHKQLAQMIMEFCNGSAIVRENKSSEVRPNKPRHSGVRKTRR